MTGPTLEIYSDGVKIRICIFLLLKQLQKQDFLNEKKNVYRDPKLQYAYREGLLAHSESDFAVYNYAYLVC